MKKTKSPYFIALALFLVGVGYLLLSAFSEGGTYFLQVSEALAMQPEDLRSARLFGTVHADGIARPADVPGVRFQLEDPDNLGNVMWVNYKGAVPDTFKPGAEVIVEGGFTQHSRDFQAKSLMTKCPSKYQKENRG